MYCSDRKEIKKNSLFRADESSIKLFLIKKQVKNFNYKVNGRYFREIKYKLKVEIQCLLRFKQIFEVAFKIIFLPNNQVKFV